METGTLEKTALDGVRFVMLARLGSETLQFVAAVALARLVTPAAFGHAAVALIFVPFAVILTFEGFASALVQRPTIDEEHRRSGAFTSITAGVLLTALTFAVGPWLGRIAFDDETGRLIQIVSPVFLLGGLAAVSRAEVWRRLDFRRMSIIDVTGLLAGSVVSVTLAALGFGSRAIVVGAVATTAVSTALLVVAAPPPVPRWHWPSQRDIGRFGVPAALAGIVHVLFSNLPYALVAGRLNATAAGIYWRSFQLGVVYQDKLSQVMMQMAFPVYSRTTDREHLRRLHERATRVHAAAIFPLLATLAMVAPVLLPFLFGTAWQPAVVPTQILCIAGACAAVLTGYPQVMLAVGEPRRLFIFRSIVLVLYLGAIIVAVRHGVVVLSAVIACTYVLMLVAVARFLLEPALALPTRTIAGHVLPALAASGVLCAVALPLRWAADAALPDVATIGLLLTVPPLAYAAALRTAFPQVWNDLLVLTFRVVPRSEPVLGRLRNGNRPTTVLDTAA